MKLGTSWIHISWTNDKKLFTNAFGGWKEIAPTDSEYYSIKNMYRVYRRRNMSDTWKLAMAQKYADKINIDLFNRKVAETEVEIETVPETIDEEVIPQPVVSDEDSKKKELLTNTLQKMIDFFSEFDFEPNFRFVNTFARIAYYYNDTAVKSYVRNYFKLTDSPYVDSIVEKMKSSEFTQLTTDLKVFKPSHDVNTRFKLYYGSAGTGKTTAAMKESAGKCMVCHSAMLPSDLMEDFKFEDGKATFKASALQNAIVNGETIVLDEINLLPFESLRFLQSILDGKKQFLYKGHEINIADGFKIIGTMNLTVNGTTYALPEPLVDRCEDIKEYKLSAENLLGAII